jgi:hypothetical protein
MHFFNYHLPVLLLLAGSAWAQSTLPQPVLNTLFPCAAQTGSTVEVTVTGTLITDAQRLHFHVSGIDCKPGSKPGKFLLTIGKDVPVGFHDVRVITPDGISNPRVLAITALPVKAIAANEKLSLGQVAVATAAKQASTRYSFEGKKGATVQVLCEAAQLDSRMEPVVQVRNANDEILARLKRDGQLSFTPPADGSYQLEVSDLMYRGDADYPFLLGLSQPNANGLERKPALTPTEAQNADLTKPVIVEESYVGWFPARSKSRVFTFTAKKGEVRIIEVKSARLGAEADPHFIFEKVAGETASFIAEGADRPAIATKAEFDAGWADPSYRFDVKEDGTYRITLRNLFPTQVPFELYVGKPSNAFQLVALPSEITDAKKTTTAIYAAPLWRGGLSTVKVYAQRERGNTAAIALTATGLPPGVTVVDGLIPADQNIGYLSFQADPKAAAWAGAVKVQGTCNDFKTTAQGAIVIRPTANTAREAIYTRLTQEVPLAVVAHDAPVLIAPELPMHEATATAKLSVKLKLTRSASFTDALKLTALGIGGATPPVSTIAAKANEGTLELDLAKLKLTPGVHHIVLQSTAKFPHSTDGKAKPKDLTATVHSKPIVLTVK